MMNTHVAKLMAFSVLLKITDLLAPSAITHVITSVMLNAIRSGACPNTVIVSAMRRVMAPPASESKLALSAHAQALVPIGMVGDGGCTI